jgi:putative spermidine/putrescine transport system substrate-binding protein
MPCSESVTNRRTFLKQAGLSTAVGLTAIAGCVSDPSSGSQVSEDNPLRIALSSGAFREQYTTHIVEPFTEETDIPTESVEIGNPPQAFPQFESAVRNDEAPVDVILNTVPTTLRGINSDMWTGFEPDRFENLQYFEDRFTETVDDQIVGVTSQGWFLNLVHNTDVMGDDPPTSWMALWDEKYEDMLGAYNLANTNYLIDVTAELHFNGASTVETNEGVEQVLEKLAEAKPQMKLWFDSGSTFLQRLKQGDVPAGQYYHDVTHFEAQAGAPVKSVFVDEGSVISYGHFSMLRTSEKTDAAAQFMDFSMRPEVQDAVAENLFTTPLMERDHSEISDEKYQEIAGPGPGEALAPNFNLYLGDRSEQIREMWNEFVIQ